MIWGDSMQTFTLTGDNNRLYFKEPCKKKTEVIDILQKSGYHMERKTLGPSEDMYIFSKDDAKISLIADEFDDDMFIYSEDGIDMIGSIFDKG